MKIERVAARTRSVDKRTVTIVIDRLSPGYLTEPSIEDIGIEVLDPKIPLVPTFEDIESNLGYSLI